MQCPVLIFLIPLRFTLHSLPLYLYQNTLTSISRSSYSRMLFLSPAFRLSSSALAVAANVASPLSITPVLRASVAGLPCNCLRMLAYAWARSFSMSITCGLLTLRLAPRLARPFSNRAASSRVISFRASLPLFCSIRFNTCRSSALFRRTSFGPKSSSERMRSKRFIALLLAMPPVP